MKDIKASINAIIAELKQDRDELRLKYELAKLEANAEWIRAEEKLLKLEAKARELGNATAESSQDVAAAAKLLGEEIRDGFKNITKHL